MIIMIVIKHRTEKRKSVIYTPMRKSAKLGNVNDGNVNFLGIEDERAVTKMK